MVDRLREKLTSEKKQIEQQIVDLENDELAHKEELEDLDEEESELPSQPPQLTRQSGYSKSEKPGTEESDIEETDEETDIAAEEEDIEEEEDSEEELVDTEEFLKKLSQIVDNEKMKKFEKKRHVYMSKNEVEDKIKNLLTDFSNTLTAGLKPHQRKFRNGYLNDTEINEVIDLHNDLREDVKDRIELTIDNLDEKEDLSDRFYMFMNNYFNRQFQRVERLTK